MNPDLNYHTGLVVADLEAAMKWFSDTAGYRWCEPFEGEQLVQLPDREVTLTLSGTYSVGDGGLELVAAVPDTLWQPANAGVHHLGYWSDDVDKDVQALLDTGAELEAKSVMPDGAAAWAYCRAGFGPRIEFVTSLLRPVMEDYFAKGSFA